MAVTTERLRMRDVCERTGLARSTIHHYIREGVLPRPVKTGRNTAWYDEDFVRRALVVKQLQEKTHMPLAAIRDALNQVPDGTATEIDIGRFADMTQSVARALRVAAERPMRRDDLAAAAGIGAEELDGMKLAGLIEPDDGETYSPLDVAIVMAVARIREAGATVERGFGGSAEVVNAYREHLTRLARTEARAFVRFMPRLSGLDLDAFVARMAEPLGDLVAAVHHKALVRAITGLIDEGDTDGDP